MKNTTIILLLLQFYTIIQYFLHKYTEFNGIYTVFVHNHTFLCINIILQNFPKMLYILNIMLYNITIKLVFVKVYRVGGLNR